MVGITSRMSDFFGVANLNLWSGLLPCIRWKKSSSLESSHCLTLVEQSLRNFESRTKDIEVFLLTICSSHSFFVQSNNHLANNPKAS